MIYNWQQPDWPEFRYNLQEVEDELFAFAVGYGQVSGMLNALPDDIRTEAILNMMVSEAIKTSEIEGEYFSREDVISSIRNNLGLNINHEKIKDQRAKGAGELMVAVRENYALPLTDTMLLSWHKKLMKHNTRIAIGAWRTHKDPMQVGSGAIGKEKIHFEAPPSSVVPYEMHRFIKWFNDTAPGGNKEIKKAPLRSAIAHLYFESIHPFEDGNGRIGRAIAEKALSQTIGHPVILSLSQTIEADKKIYYASLEKAQRKNDITDWINYFVTAVLNAQIQAKKLIDFTVKKTRFFDRFKDQLNNRQVKVVKRMMDGFEGGMSAKKYISITKASKATATRDLQILVDIGAMVIQGGGRSTHYFLQI